MTPYGLAGWLAGHNDIQPEANPCPPESESWRQCDTGNRRAWAEREAGEDKRIERELCRV